MMKPLILEEEPRTGEGGRRRGPVGDEAVVQREGSGLAVRNERRSPQ